MEQSPVGQRLKFLIEKLGMSARAFSIVIDESPTNTQNYIGKRNSVPSADYLEKVSNHFENVNPIWLFTGRGQPFLSDSPTSTTQTGNFNQAGTSNKQTIKGQGNTVGTNHGTTTQASARLAECEKERDNFRVERDAFKQERDAALQQIELLRQLLEAKDEMLSLLRASQNRPN